MVISPFLPNSLSIECKSLSYMIEKSSNKLIIFQENLTSRKKNQVWKLLVMQFWRLIKVSFEIDVNVDLISFFQCTLNTKRYQILAVKCSKLSYSYTNAFSFDWILRLYSPLTKTLNRDTFIAILWHWYWILEWI